MELKDSARAFNLVWVCMVEPGYVWSSSTYCNRDNNPKVSESTIT
jgi:hypothetical protein